MAGNDRRYGKRCKRFASRSHPPLTSLFASATSGSSDVPYPVNTVPVLPGAGDDIALGRPYPPPMMNGAGEGNRTLVTWLGTKSSTIELHPPRLNTHRGRAHSRLRMVHAALGFGQLLRHRAGGARCGPPPSVAPQSKEDRPGKSAMTVDVFPTGYPRISTPNELTVLASAFDHTRASECRYATHPYTFCRAN
jgi:hypothetical protein